VHAIRRTKINPRLRLPRPARVTDTFGVTKGLAPRDHRLTTRIPTSLHEALKRVAAEDKRTLSDWIVVTLEAVIAERERPTRRR
jgi:hypothetical protein